MNGSQLAPTAQININTASVEQLASLMGVGKAKAEAIVSIRKKKSFSLPSDLLKVPGFGPRLLELNKKYITIPTSTLTTTNNKRPATLASKESRRLKQPSFYTKKCKKSSRIKQTRAAAAKHTNGCFTTTPYSDRVASLTSYSKTPPVTPGTSRVDTNIAAATTTASAAASHAKDVPRTSDVGCAGRLRSTSNAEAKHCKEELAAAKVSIKSCSSDAAAACSHENHVPKRKPDSKHGKSGGVGPSPSKKSCKSAEPSNPASPNNTAQPLNSGNVVHTFGTIITSSSQSCTSVAAMRRKIPSKNNPPTDLPPWLKTFQDWSHAERMLALDEIIAMCEPTQVRHIMAVIEPQFQRDFISLLPKELALYVLSFLEPRDLLQAAQTCSYWRILSEDNLLWREKCKEESIEWVPPVPRPPSGATKALRRGRYGSAASSSSSAGDGAVGDCGTNQTVTAPPWKELYMKQHQIEQNWRHAAINNTYRRKVLKGHDDHVITCLEFCGNRIVSGSDDNTLKVWSADTGKCLRTLVGHTGGVWSSQMRDNIIISGSTDRTLRVWDADTGECVHALYGHSSTVRCMHLHEEHVVSGSRDATLRVWEVATGRCVHVLMGHVAAVRCVQYDGKYIVSGAYDYSVKVWDAETETCLHTLQGHTNRVYSLQFDGSHIVSGSLDTSIRVWDVETGNCLHTLIGHQSLTSGMELKDNILVSGNADSTVKVWDITTGQCLTTLQGANKHQSAVTCLQFNKKFVITSSDDGTVKIWDLRRGEFVRNLVSLASGGSGGVVWRVRCSNTRLVCAVGSRNGTEETKLLVINFDCDDKVASSNKTNCTKDKITRSSAAAAQRMVENGVDNANHNNDADPSHSDSDLDY